MLGMGQLTSFRLVNFQLLLNKLPEDSCQLLRYIPITLQSTKIATKNSPSIASWWFGVFFRFSISWEYSLNIPTDVHSYFLEGLVETTNQIVDLPTKYADFP